MKRLLFVLFALTASVAYSHTRGFSTTTQQGGAAFDGDLAGAELKDTTDGAVTIDATDVLEGSGATKLNLNTDGSLIVTNQAGTASFCLRANGANNFRLNKLDCSTGLDMTIDGNFVPQGATMIGGTSTDVRFRAQFILDFDTVAVDDTSPSVLDTNNLKTQANTQATDILDLDQSNFNQLIRICGGSDTFSSTISHGVKFTNIGDATVTLSLDSCHAYWVRAPDDYVEVSNNDAVAGFDGNLAGDILRDETDGQVTIDGGDTLGWSSATILNGQTDGDLLLTNAAGTDFECLQLGSTTNATICESGGADLTIARGNSSNPPGIADLRGLVMSQMRIPAVKGAASSGIAMEGDVRLASDQGFSWSSGASPTLSTAADTELNRDSAGIVRVTNGAASGLTAQIYARAVNRSATSPTEPETCAINKQGLMVWADDTDDSAAGAMCVCIATGDNGAGTPNAFDWVRMDDNGTACPFF